MIQSFLAFPGFSGGVFVANLEDPATLAAVLIGPPRRPGPAHTAAHYLKILAESSGTFTVTNTRNGFSKTYTKKPQ